jgi:hypothetical protein
MKLHMRVRLARTSWETSLTILALSLGDSVVNHLARRCSEERRSGQNRDVHFMARQHGERLTTLPCRDSRIKYLLCSVHVRSFLRCKGDAYRIAMMLRETSGWSLVVARGVAGE